jgi:hypothetical protein
LDGQDRRSPCFWRMRRTLKTLPSKTIYVSVKANAKESSFLPTPSAETFLCSVQEAPVDGKGHTSNHVL